MTTSKIKERDDGFEVETRATIDGRMRDGELLARLPEVERISDSDLRDEAKSALARGLPDYFWKVPATSSGYYHHPYTRQRYGLWIHTKQVFTAYERMVRSYVEQGLITEYEADCGRAACLLHDMLKYGHSYNDGDSTKGNSDRMAGHWLRQNTDLPKAVVKAVESHNGPWRDGPTPDSPLSQLVHQADMVASTKNITVGVYKPHEKIQESYPSIPRATFQ